MDAASRLKSLRSMLEATPDDTFLNYAVALELCTNAGTFTEAETLLKRVISLDSDYTAAYYQLGKLLEQTGRTDEALAAYKSGHSVAIKKRDLKSAGEFSEAIFLLED